METDFTLVPWDLSHTKNTRVGPFYEGLNICMECQALTVDHPLRAQQLLLSRVKFPEKRTNQLWQQDMSPDIAKCYLGTKSASLGTTELK